VELSISVKKRVTVPAGRSCTQHLLTTDAQRIPDIPGPLVSMIA